MSFMDNYLNKDTENVFSNVQVLIYVFDIESRDVEADLEYYKNTLDALIKYSADSKVYCFFHKMDLIPEAERSVLYAKREAEVKKRTLPLTATCLMTSIWDETLYRVRNINPRLGHRLYTI